MVEFPIFKGSWVVTLTLDQVILHTVMHIYIPNFLEIEETFCGRTDGHLRPALLVDD